MYDYDELEFEGPDDDTEEEDADCFGCKYLDTKDSTKPYHGICMIDRQPRDLSIDLYCDFSGRVKLDNNYINDYYAYKYSLK